MMMKFHEDFAYCMAHHLPTFPEGHKCRNIHGHTCVLTVTVEVPDGPGYTFDHAAMRATMVPIVKQLCHAGMINDLAPELADGLAESQLRWFWPQLAAAAHELGATLVGPLIHAEYAGGSGCVLMAHRKSYMGEVVGSTP